MKTINEALASPGNKWERDEYGLVMYLPGSYEIRIEELLFGGFYLAVYRDTELIGEKLPITLGTPGQNRTGGELS